MNTKEKKKKGFRILLAFLLCAMMTFVLLPQASVFAADSVVTLTHGTDGNGTITEWMLKGDADRSAGVNNEDAQFISEYTAINDPAYTFITSNALAFESADVDSNANPNSNDSQRVLDLTQGHITLPTEDYSFRVIDKPNTGYKITSATIKTDANADVVLTPASPTSGNYKLVIASDGTGTVTGESLLGENNVYFIHELESDLVYGVAYDGNGNDGGTVPVDNNTYHANDSVTISMDVPTKTNYKFKGWKIKTEYHPGDTFSFDAAHIALADENRVINLVAQWAPATVPSPKTGDSSPFALCMMFMVLGLGGIGFSAMYLKNKTTRKEN